MAYNYPTTITPTFFPHGPRIYEGGVWGGQLGLYADMAINATPVLLMVSLLVHLARDAINKMVMLVIRCLLYV